MLNSRIEVPLLLVTVPVFNLEISQSGSYVPHVILNWVILKIVWVKLSFLINFILHLTKLTNKIHNK